MSTTLPRGIAGMPNDVLLRLFQLLAADGSVSSQGARARVGRVCKRWRTVSRLNRSLWTFISIDIEEPDPDADVESNSDSDSDADVDYPDKFFLNQCLCLSHPLPLDIHVTYNSHNSEHPSLGQMVTRTLTSLARHCIRWRSFKCTAPTSFVYGVTRSASGFRGSNLLEALSLRCNDQSMSIWDGTLIGITLHPSVSRIDVTLDISSIKRAHWANITSLTAGFEDNSYCHRVLSQTTSLHTLFLIHLGPEEAKDPRRRPTVLHSVRHLKVTPCAVLGLLDQFRFPQVDQLSLAEPPVALSNHKRSGNCPNRSVTSYDVERLCTTLELPGNPRHIRRLNIDWFTIQYKHPSTLSPLFRLFETSIAALHIEFGRGDLYDTRSFFHSLIISGKTPLLPNLSELHLSETREPSSFGTYSPDLYGDNAFENMVVSRCGSSKAVLRTLRLISKALVLDPEDFALSSLCMTLQGLSSKDLPKDERLDVEWVLGSVDILQEGRSYAQMLY